MGMEPILTNWMAPSVPEAFGLFQTVRGVDVILPSPIFSRVAFCQLQKPQVESTTTVSFKPTVDGRKIVFPLKPNDTDRFLLTGVLTPKLATSSPW